MHKDKKILALIPARGGSKSIPKKNIVDLGGFPLIAYSIAAAKMSPYISRVLVSTDSSEIAEVAKHYGVQVPFLRPAEYARDDSPDIEFFRHAFDWLQEYEGYVPDLVVHLRPTTPLREPALIDKAIKEIIGDEHATALRSAHESEHTAYKLFRKEGEYIHFFGQEDFAQNEEYYNRGRQFLPKTYNPNGYVDVIRPEVLQQTGMLHGLRIRAFITERVADIDRREDIAFAEKLLGEEKFRPLLRFLENQKLTTYA
ncbi:MAG: acylneuraminate cytidylyltransferase family protein [Candidatus Wildermuthbacteria bacterium]|nr:acylneuraminate cytidylyltransferase family protein [Candidatus Wildermuthbacteria bacterium]